MCWTLRLKRIEMTLVICELIVLRRRETGRQAVSIAMQQCVQALL